MVKAILLLRNRPVLKNKLTHSTEYPRPGNWVLMWLYYSLVGQSWFWNKSKNIPIMYLGVQKCWGFSLENNYWDQLSKIKKTDSFSNPGMPLTSSSTHDIYCRLWGEDNASTIRKGKEVII